MPRLATEHVWDAFVIYSLLDDKQRNGERLKVPHIGDQADKFTYAMEERNCNIILYEQPDSVTHACDKCLRVYETGGGEIRKSLQSTLNFPEVLTDGVSDCQATATQLWAMTLVWAVHAVGSLLKGNCKPSLYITLYSLLFLLSLRYCYYPYPPLFSLLSLLYPFMGITFPFVIACDYYLRTATLSTTD